MHLPFPESLPEWPEWERSELTLSGDQTQDAGLFGASEDLPWLMGATQEPVPVRRRDEQHQCPFRMGKTGRSGTESLARPFGKPSISGREGEGEAISMWPSDRGIALLFSFPPWEAALFPACPRVCSYSDGIVKTSKRRYRNPSSESSK